MASSHVGTFDPDLRDRLACSAMQGVLSGLAGAPCPEPEWLAEYAYTLADAMVLERAVEPISKGDGHPTTS